MTETEKKALALVNEVREERGYSDQQTYPADRKFPPFEALCRAIEQHEAFRQEVSDGVEQAVAFLGPPSEKLRRGRLAVALARFIIAKPDPLVEVINDADDMVRKPDAPSYAEAIRAALAARGLEIREKSND